MSIGSFIYSKDGTKLVFKREKRRPAVKMWVIERIHCVASARVLCYWNFTQVCLKQVGATILINFDFMRLLPLIIALFSKSVQQCQKILYCAHFHPKPLYRSRMLCLMQLMYSPAFMCVICWAPECVECSSVLREDFGLNLSGSIIFALNQQPRPNKQECGWMWPVCHIYMNV